MKKGIKKTDNYFERNRRIRLAQNYRYNFIDYLYYQGERYSKKYLLDASLYRYSGEYIGKNEFNG